VAQLKEKNMSDGRTVEIQLMLKLDSVHIAVYIFFQLINFLSIATYIGGNHQVFIESVAIYLIYKFSPYLTPSGQDLLSL